MTRRFPALDATSIKEHMQVSNACWLWTGKRNREGYGRYGGKFAHRLSYEIFKGRIPSGFHIDHLCFNPSCIRPEHLQAVEPHVNARRNLKSLAQECQKGHPFTPENTGLKNHGKRVQRYCKTCDNARQRRDYRNRKATGKAA